jgi:pyruvate,water dikinase
LSLVDFSTDGKRDRQAALREVRDRFRDFLILLERNGESLRVMSDMEEKAHGHHLFDITYLRESLKQLRNGVGEISDRLIRLGGDQYRSLLERFAEINVEIENLLPGRKAIRVDDFVIPLEQLGRGRALSVGSKSAHLGELKSMLKLPVPEGFAVSAWAYRHFIDSNKLQRRIDKLIGKLDVKCYADLVQVSDEIQQLIIAAPIPEDLARALDTGFTELSGKARSQRFAVRSSAIGEDTLYSFAGQYATFLDVAADEIHDRYRQVLASKFTPQAIFYFLSNSLAEAELPMSVCCVEMVNTRVSGVIYTRDPVSPNRETLLINSIFGLGKYLVDGTVTADCYHVARADGRLLAMEIAAKTKRMVLTQPTGIEIDLLATEEQRQSSLDAEWAPKLAEYAVRLENHFGCPLDIEWAIDHEDNLYFLQARPLHVVSATRSRSQPDQSYLDPLLSGGTTVCPGAGAGQVVHIGSTHDLGDIPKDAVLVAANSFPGLITTMRQTSAIIVTSGGVASHMATIAREYRVPTLAGMKGAASLPSGEVVTVDASSGRVYAGCQEELLETRRRERDGYGELPIVRLLKEVLAKVTPLHLLRPGDDDFQAAKCQTFHDILRFAHQRGIEEMFRIAHQIGEQQQISRPLQTDIPVQVHTIFIDDELRSRRRGPMRDTEIPSRPMQAFWNGIKQEGWPAAAVNPSGKMLKAARTQPARSHRGPFGEDSFAILSREYMLLSLHLGFHFTSFEAICSGQENKNFVRMQHKDGGAQRDRRIRRVTLMAEVLSRLGFEVETSGDFFSCSISHLDIKDAEEKLGQLGRITMLTKQLDMALSNDEVAAWYTHDILRKLGLVRK